MRWIAGPAALARLDDLERLVRDQHSRLSEGLADRITLKSDLAHAEADAQSAQKAAAGAEIEVTALRKEVLALQREIEELRKPPPKPALAVCPRCPSTEFHVVRAIVGWRGTGPDAIGGTLQCLRCGSLLHVVEGRAEVAKPVSGKTPAGDKKPPKPKDDSDLQWGE